MLAAIGAVERSGASPRERLVEALSGRSGVLVLDNCERVISAVADLVAELLDRCPRLRVLTTSRHPLRLEAEHTQDLL